MFLKYLLCAELHIIKHFIWIIKFLNYINPLRWMFMHFEETEV